MGAIKGGELVYCDTAASQGARQTAAEETHVEAADRRRLGVLARQHGERELALLLEEAVEVLGVLLQHLVVALDELLSHLGRKEGGREC